MEYFYVFGKQQLTLLFDSCDCISNATLMSKTGLVLKCTYMYMRWYGDFKTRITIHIYYKMQNIIEIIHYLWIKIQVTSKGHLKQVFIINVRFRFISFTIIVKAMKIYFFKVSIKYMKFRWFEIQTAGSTRRWGGGGGGRFLQIFLGKKLLFLLFM